MKKRPIVSVDQKNTGADQKTENTEQKIRKHKLNFKQKVLRWLLAGAAKDKGLKKALQQPIESLIVNFREGVVQVPDVDNVFWTYFNHDMDIAIPKHIEKNMYFEVVFPFPEAKKEMSIKRYTTILNDIRSSADAFVRQVRPLLKDAHQKALPQETQEIYSPFEEEEYRANVHQSARKSFEEGLVQLFAGRQECYDLDRFKVKKDTISERVPLYEHQHLPHDHTELILFALLGMHYFHKKSEVYQTFTDEQLEYPIHFVYPDSVLWFDIPLKNFLYIIEHLDFNKHFFDL